jgi:hypothetical protein
MMLADATAQAGFTMATYERARRECRIAEQSFADAACLIQSIQFHRDPKADPLGRASAALEATE